MRNHEERIAELEGEIKSLRKIGRTKRNPVKGIGGNIQRLREEQLVGLKELAKLAGVSAGLVCKIETTPNANVELHTILRLASALRVEPAALISNGTTKPKRKSK
jgi:transcriptional regulator with XRE-family HTH domain